MQYQGIQGYQQYQQFPQPYQDRLAQLQNQYNQTIPPQAQQAPQTNQGILWVQGEAGAKSYLVAPNTTVLLMDSESSKFYLKSTDGAGMPSTRTFEYKEIVQDVSQAAVQNQTKSMDDKYVTREEYNQLQKQYSEIMDKLDSFHTPVPNEDSSKRATTRGNTTRSKGGGNNE